MIDPYATVEATPEQQAAYAEQSTETMLEAIARLAKLHSLDYEKIRETERSGKTWNQTFVRIG